MRQIWIPRAGAPDVLEVREADDPEPGGGEVRIRVHASGINFADIMARMGLYQDAPPLPTVVGYEVAGVVDRVGEGVNNLSEGDRVVSLTRFGGYSDTVVVSADQAQPLADNVSFEAAAAVPVNYLTAWLMIVYLGNVKSHETVLVHAAGGGVGQAAVQICKHAGARIIGTASAPKHERLKASGVAHCIDYRSQDFESEVLRYTEGRGVDIVIDAVGGDSFRKSYRCLAPLGRLFMFGASSIAPGKKRSIITALRGVMAMPKFKPIGMMNENRGVFGVNLGHLWEERELLASQFRKILELVEKGELAPVVDETFKFDDAAAAHTYIQERKNFGKVLLVP